MSLVALPLLLISICISSAMINYNRFAEKDFRVPASVVFNNYGILLCAKQCEQSGKCVAINFNPSLLICELVFYGKQDSYDGDGWWHFKDMSWLQEAGISTGKYRQTCGSKSSVRLSSGIIHCIDPVVPMDCQDIQKSQLAVKSGIYRIFLSQNPLDVSCDMENDGGGWTVIQARKDGSVDFYRTWNEYKAGFGNVTGEMWLGNDNIHALLSKSPYMLRIDMEDFDGNKRYARYATFSLANEDEFYKITICCYTGTAGDSASRMNGKKFTTKDRDNDTNRRINCASLGQSGWWFSSCLTSNLNGKYYDTGLSAYADSGIIWSTWHGYEYSYKAVSMKVKRRNNWSFLQGMVF